MTRDELIMTVSIPFGTTRKVMGTYNGEPFCDTIPAKEDPEDFMRRKLGAAPRPKAPKATKAAEIERIVKSHRNEPEPEAPKKRGGRKKAEPKPDKPKKASSKKGGKKRGK